MGGTVNITGPRGHGQSQEIAYAMDVDSKNITLGLKTTEVRFMDNLKVMVGAHICHFVLACGCFKRTVHFIDHTL